MTQDSPVVFISYATPDRARVQPFGDYLKAQGLAVWIDHEKLRPGENWDFEIDRALSRADFVLVFISNNSVDRRGYVQRELKAALDRLTEKLIDDIFLIPVLLDEDVTVPRQLAHLHHISASRSDCHEQMKEAIDRQLEKLGTARRAVETERGLMWHLSRISESWEGLPGYEVAIQYIEVSSSQHKGLGDIGDYIKGQLLHSLLNYRALKLEQLPRAFNHAQSKMARTNTFDAICGTPTIVGDVLTIPYNITWYGAGAAHPQHIFRIFNFYLNPAALMPSLEAQFADSAAALAAIQEVTRTSLSDIKDESGNALLDRKWIDEGTTEWAHFDSHGYVADGLRIFFPPYQVGAYAFGPHAVTVPYPAIVKFFRPEFVSALGLSFVLFEATR